LRGQLDEMRRLPGGKQRIQGHLYEVGILVGAVSRAVVISPEIQFVVSLYERCLGSGIDAAGFREHFTFIDQDRNVSAEHVFRVRQLSGVGDHHIKIHLARILFVQGEKMLQVKTGTRTRRTKKMQQLRFRIPVSDQGTVLEFDDIVWIYRAVIFWNGRRQKILKLLVPENGRNRAENSGEYKNNSSDPHAYLRENVY
jgi:hypothetical protein